MPDIFVHIKNGDLLAVRRVVEESGTTFSISAYSTIGLTPLGAAIYYGKTDIIKFLLEAGADIKEGYKSQFCKDKDLFQLENWPQISPAIHCAAASGATEDILRLLVDHGADVNDSSARDYGAEVLPLYVATGQATQALINLGADVCQQNAIGFTPLVHALAREDVNSVRLLIEHGADVHIERTPKYKIRTNAPDNDDDSDIVGEELLVQGGSSPLIVASHQGRLRPSSFEMFGILAKAGVDMNKRYHLKDAPSYFDGGFTLLSLICGSRTKTPRLRGQYANNDRYGQKELQAIKAIIEAGVDVNSPPVIHYVCDGVMPFTDFESRSEVLRMLVQAGARSNHSHSGSSAMNASATTTLLKSFNKCSESEIQFQTMAAILDKAGAQWSGMENFDVATLPDCVRDKTADMKGHLEPNQ
ncbi:hypothetical protein PFICI_08569 [Pestalotiopsis fici W106-1]|uniref:Uncharacterized protein n=1 Tax=Pestalotiopsis fici (strain W106-1 / CGMCC3.15140) TaxID=1229662 RepID=W3X0R3_PESFW|nr:uncharacterized protein PFICI_08569 [Pestalotiopsis fici W106-1]ETS78716.1 hypothetical protein PFICI_08569 [Pestalotiopsis fici W106-1]